LKLQLTFEVLYNYIIGLMFILFILFEFAKLYGVLTLAR